MWSVVTVVKGKLTVLYMTDECVVLKKSQYTADRNNNGINAKNAHLKLCNEAELDV